MAKKTQQDWIDTIRKKLTGAGRSGLTKSKIGSSSPGFDRALEALIDSGEVIRLGPARGGLFFLPEFAPDLESVAAELDRAVGALEPKLLTKAELARWLKNPAKNKFAEQAIPLMVADGVFAEFRRGKSNSFFLHLGALDRARGVVAGAGSPAESDFKAVLPAYEALHRETGFVAVDISALAKRAGIDLGELKAYLLGEAQAGRAELSVSDWSFASDEVRSGSIEVRGQKFLQVQLK